MSPPAAPKAKPNRLNDPLIVERLAAEHDAEVALVRAADDETRFAVFLIWPEGEGTFVLRLLVGFGTDRAALKSRMADAHAGVLAVQRLMTPPAGARS